MEMSKCVAGGTVLEKEAVDLALEAEAEGLDPEEQKFPSWKKYASRKKYRSKKEFRCGKKQSEKDNKEWFQYVQLEDGSVGTVRHSKEADGSCVNFKKKICSAIQADFKGPASMMDAGPTSRQEDDPTSRHIAKYL